MEFEEWMISEGLSTSTAEKYRSAIAGPLTTWARMHRIFEADSLYQIADTDIFASISEKIVITPEFEDRNLRGHGMYAAALRKYADFLGETLAGTIIANGHFSKQISALEATITIQSEFSPKDQNDARSKVLREIVVRRGQPKFRKELIEVYGAKCAITGCGVLSILEAAHITPYLGPATNLKKNGILLRADIHSLWDLGLIAIHPHDNRIVVNESIVDETYRILQGKTPYVPHAEDSRPSIAAIHQQWELFQNKSE